MNAFIAELEARARKLEDRYQDAKSIAVALALAEVAAAARRAHGAQLDIPVPDDIGADYADSYALAARWLYRSPMAEAQGEPEGPDDVAVTMAACKHETAELVSHLRHEMWCRVCGALCRDTEHTGWQGPVGLPRGVCGICGCEPCADVCPNAQATRA